jgi:hypothetical protein
MPFTAAHPAIVLPLARIKKIPLSALVIGSITPDFEYFIKMKLTGRYSHTLEGMFVLDLPVAFALCLIFHLLVKKPFIANLPLYVRGRLVDLQRFDFMAHLKRNFMGVIAGLLLGIASHIVWDSFTHANEFFVKQFNWLANPVVPGFPAFPLFRILQHVSTLVGSLYIVLYFHRLPHQRVTRSINILFWIVVMVVAVLVFCLRGWFTFNTMGDVVVTAISACCIGLIFSSIIYRQRYE